MSENENETTEETPDAPVEEAAVEETAAEATPVEETDAVEAPAEPEAEAAAEEPEAEAAEAAPPAVSQPKKKRKRLPRSLRPHKGGRTRERATERKPISREPKPEHERGRNQERRGVVVSDAMDKTIVVKVDSVKAHPRYKKVIRDRKSVV